MNKIAVLLWSTDSIAFSQALEKVAVYSNASYTWKFFFQGVQGIIDVDLLSPVLESSMLFPEDGLQYIPIEN